MTDTFTHPRDAEPGHEWQTRDGRAVRVLAHDVKNNTHPIAALVSYSNGDEWPISFEECGRLLARDESNVDLIDAPKTRTVWVNCYSGGLLSGHGSKESAEGSRASDCEACVKLTYKVGEGL